MNPESVHFIAREILVLCRLDHPNLMKLEGFVTARVSGNLYLVFEYMENDLAASPAVKFTESQSCVKMARAKVEMVSSEEEKEKMVRVKVEVISSEEEEEVAEDWCFECKDGGKLIICDYRGCLKSYHPRCVGKDESFLTSDKSWICRRHKCIVCREKNPSYNCYCCVRAVCNRCIGHIGFAVIKNKYGFCNNCLKIAVLVEKDLNVDSDGESVDLKDRETYKCLFREYYEIIKEKEGFDKNCILAAKAKMEKESTLIISCDDDVPSEEKDGESVLDDREAHKQGLKKKRRRQQKEKMMQRKVNSKKKEYVGWGSKALIDFLHSIGQDTREKLSLRAVTSKVINYIKEHSLTHPVKKGRVICDAQLQAVFRKKEVDRHRIYGLLESHFTENEEQSEGQNHDDDPEFSASKKSEPNRISSILYSAAAKSEFAAVIPENINLVYLKKSLLLEIIKQPHSVENKLIGSFVRVKSNPHDNKRNTPHQLAQIAGVKLGSSDKHDTEISLQVSDMPGDVCLSWISDADFSQEECESLREKVKAGLLKMLTVVDLEQKVKLLHADIVKHRIAEEVRKLEILIDVSNERGWRTQMFDHFERKRLIQQPGFLGFQLDNIPLVIADDIEPEPEAKDEKDGGQIHQCSEETTNTIDGATCPGS